MQFAAYAGLIWFAVCGAALAQPIETARGLMSEGRFLEAAAVLEPLVAAEPDNAAAWNMLGAANNYGERYRRANEAAERAVALAPDMPGHRFNRALTRWELGDFEGALADHESVLAQQPQRASALTERGATLAALGRFDEAEASWAASLEADPSYIWAHFYRGQVLVAKGQYEAAAAQFAIVLERQDFYPARLWNWIALRRGGLAAPDLPAQEAWPGAVGAHLRGEISRAALYRAARASGFDLDERRVMNAHYFAGQRALAEGRTGAARAAFRQVLRAEAPSFIERWSAQYELEQMAGR